MLAGLISYVVMLAVAPMVCDFFAFKVVSTTVVDGGCMGRRKVKRDELGWSATSSTPSGTY